MKITYDKDVDALYIRFRKGGFAKNKVIDDFTILDMDKKDHILGIEILNASKRMPLKSLASVNFEEISGSIVMESKTI